MPAFHRASAVPGQILPPPSPAQVHVEPFVFEPVHIEPFVLAQTPKPFKEAYVEFKGNEPHSAEMLYSQARNFIERDQYDRALAPLDRVIDARAERADAAMYWKAYSLWKLARPNDAMTTLSQLQKQYVDSRWIRDARALEVEVKQAAGQPVSADMANDDVKLLALQGIMRTDPDAALPVVEKMLAGNASVRLKERALFVLIQNRSPRAQEIVGNVARSGSNPDLQQRAIRYLGQSNSPEALGVLANIYKAESSLDTRRIIISAIGSNPNAAGTLVAMARAERNPDLRKQLVQQLSTSRAPEAKAYMLELLR